MKKLHMAVAAGIVLVGAVVLLLRSGGPEQPGQPEPQSFVASQGVESSATEAPSIAPGTSSSEAEEKESDLKEAILSSAGIEEMTPEEVADISESFEVSAPMTEFLDTGDEASALKEARRLASHPNREVRMDALDVMRWIGGAAAIDMVAFFGDQDPEINALAEEAFWEAIDEIDDPVLSIRMMETALNSPSAALRLEAVDRLVYLPDHLSFPSIARMMNDENQEVRDLAQENLRFISEEEFSSEAEALSWFSQNEKELIDLFSE
ncbi:hypothetical protein SCARR_02161 [Pontiella sulfatireligans]|uniref:HEAT repeat domain-containing protein n=2 Tax=Pontiella sulfatireligans TaxID=2750658 RepID=A0A6C2UL18_9BACT|nr:hypothetical protein SCARR_02161 [Pontiella sulfatireligans]